MLQADLLGREHTAGIAGYGVAALLDDVSQHFPQLICGQAWQQQCAPHQAPQCCYQPQKQLVHYDLRVGS